MTENDILTLDQYIDKQFGPDDDKKATYVDRIRSDIRSSVRIMAWIGGAPPTALAQTDRGPWKGSFDTDTGVFEPTHFLPVDQARIEHQQALLTMFSHKTLPPMAVGPIERYVEHRLDPGYFYRALLENNAVAAIGYGDHIAVSMIHIVYNHLIHKVDPQIWRSPEAVRRHIGY
jgi:hypothetical protein